MGNIYKETKRDVVFLFFANSKTMLETSVGIIVGNIFNLNLLEIWNPKNIHLHG